MAWHKLYKTLDIFHLNAKSSLILSEVSNLPRVAPLKLLLNTKFTWMRIQCSRSAAGLSDSRWKIKTCHKTLLRNKRLLSKNNIYFALASQFLIFMPSNNIKANFDHMWVNRILKSCECICSWKFGRNWRWRKLSCFGYEFQVTIS